MGDVSKDAKEKGAKKASFAAKKKKEPRKIEYRDELNDEFSDAKIKPKRIDEKYEYLPKSVFRRCFFSVLYRLAAKPIAFLFLKCKFGWRVRNKKVLKKEKGAYFLYGNHTSVAADPLIPAMLAGKKHAYVVVHAANVSIPLVGNLIAALGALPLPDDKAAAKNFLAALKYRVEESEAICIYPEAHIWPYYTKIRPFVDTSFRYPVNFGVPTYTFTNTYQKRKFFKKPRIVTYVDGPFYPDLALPAKIARGVLRDEAYGAMEKRSALSDCEYIRYVKAEEETQK